MQKRPGRLSDDQALLPWLTSPPQQDGHLDTQMAAFFGVVNVAFSWTPVFGSEEVPNQNVTP